MFLGISVDTHKQKKTHYKRRDAFKGDAPVNFKTWLIFKLSEKVY